jgi:transcriptional regulator with GAF, ATPase, and Fis domain
LPEGVLESELFGHEKGAFTGAAAARAGCFERATGGTLFLDEIGEIGGEFQAKLLRVLQEGEVLRVGGSAPRTVDVRVVCATNRVLRQESPPAGFARISSFASTSSRSSWRRCASGARTSCRWRASFSIAKRRESGRALSFGADAEAALLAHPWPGNVRELEMRSSAPSCWRAARRSRPEDLLLSSCRTTAPAAIGPAARCRTRSTAPRRAHRRRPVRSRRQSHRSRPRPRHRAHHAVSDDETPRTVIGTVCSSSGCWFSDV